MATRLDSVKRRMSSPRLSRSELLGLALASVAIAVLMHWPLPLHLGRDVSRDIGDPLVQAWEVAWGGHALLHQPLDFFQANTFWPARNSLAFSEALAGYAPAGMIGEGVTAAIVRYNLLFLFAYALAFAGAYLLARELGAGRLAACVCGAAFAYAPWRLEQDGHLHVLSSGGIPLALFLLLRGYPRGSAATVLAGWLVAAWQFSLGFSLGLQLGYLLAALGAGVAVWWWRSRPRVGAAVVAATAAGVLAFALTAVVLARPYLQVLDDHPEAHRTHHQVAGLSPPLRAFVAAPERNLIWGEATAGVRDDLSSVPEQTLFPGVAIVALAILGATGPPFSRRLRIGLVASVLAIAVLSLGFSEHGSNLLHPYELLFDHLPGWKGIRVPGRLTTLASLGLALLAAGGAHRIVERVGRPRWPWRSPRPTGFAVGIALVAAILVEGSGFDVGDGLRGPAHPAVPKPPARLASFPQPQLDLPATIPANRRYVLWSTDGFPRLVNGRGSFVPAFFERVVAATKRFPDPGMVGALRSLGVRSVVFHSALATPDERARAELPLPATLGVVRSTKDGMIVYELSSR
jgi:hypothetical protein